MTEFRTNYSTKDLGFFLSRVQCSYSTWRVEVGTFLKVKSFRELHGHVVSPSLLVSIPFEGTANRKELNQSEKNTLDYI